VCARRATQELIPAGSRKAAGKKEKNRSRARMNGTREEREVKLESVPVSEEASLHRWGMELLGGGTWHYQTEVG